MTGPWTAPAGPVLRHPDRVSAAPWQTIALTVAVALLLGIAGQAAAQGQVSTTFGFFTGVGVGLLAMVGLQSVSIRLVARVLLLVSAAVLVRFGVLTGSLVAGGQSLLAWLVLAVSVLVLSDRLGTASCPPLTDQSEPRAATGGSVARSIAVVALAVVLFAALAAPFLLPLVAEPTEAGEGASLEALREGNGALRGSSSLDMTQRPDLTDEVVFTVETDRATFWRGQTFDQWDGRRWTRTDERFVPLQGGDRLRVMPNDLGASGDDTVTQRFQMETEYADIVHAAPTAVEIDIDRPVRQRPDGTLMSAPLGRGAAYTVTSRREPLSPARLRATDGGDIPTAVLDQYAREPVATLRVSEAARQITADAETQYDKILAIEAWMGDRVEYSLDAPLAPEGVDVVDHFLFEAEQGWCEQVASSLVVLARANGIPARLVTGFVPGDRDPVTGRYTVRERDAHAWAEVWFPEVGWVPFDPTADVPLAGDDAAQPTIAQWLRDRAVAIALVALAIGLAAGPLRAWLRRRKARRDARPTSWAGVADARLDVLGQRVDRVRAPSETAGAYAADLGDRLAEPDLALVGRLIDDHQYGITPTDPEDQERAQAVLDQLSQA